MDCIFCSIIDGSVPSFQVAADESAVAFLDVEPFQDGHTLVVPRRHVASVLSDDGELAAISGLVEEVARLLVDKLGASGVNVVSNAGEVAGQSVEHLHVHVIPRYREEPGFDAIRSSRPRRSPEQVHARLRGE